VVRSGAAAGAGGPVGQLAPGSPGTSCRFDWRLLGAAASQPPGATGRKITDRGPSRYGRVGRLMRDPGAPVTAYRRGRSGRAGRTARPRR